MVAGRELGCLLGYDWTNLNDCQSRPQRHNVFSQRRLQSTHLEAVTVCQDLICDRRSISMNENQLIRQGARSCFTSLIITLLAIFAMIISISRQYPSHPSCGGMLGAGFPALFICDDWGGGSPTGSWGKITLVDVPNGGIRPGGFLVDFLFYTAMIWIITVGVFHKRINRRTLWWAALISAVFIVGFLCAFLTFQSSSLYLGGSYHRTTPTPIIPSPTSPATIDSGITPSATLIFYSRSRIHDLSDRSFRLFRKVT